MRRGSGCFVILASLAALTLVMGGCGADSRIILTGRVVSVSSTLGTVYVLHGGDVLALAVAPGRTRVLGADGTPTSLAEIRPGVEILAIGHRIGQHHIVAAEIRIHEAHRGTRFEEVQVRNEDCSDRPALRERAAPPLRRD